ncbi:hypothetical protein K503DRAFT_806667 [Rhizopogon vinicolor AM-OR11-026]|uniref:Uncharacterized protein n=1 Tax=Rhizopogon vinicolor AM-OR11-026 TaxID=1314800 RepID=A0A1B7ME08_9AGAM|nr:hypothetical protein K503DRAFT_806667 [Rhizopogon vinicolor AM-OR11-026]
MEPILVSDFALRKIDKGHYVELYYWTNRGLAEARLNHHTTDDESLVPTVSASSATSWLAANATRPSSTVVPDYSLSPFEFSQAIPRVVTSLEKHGWLVDRVHMLAGFWDALMLHRYWSSDDPLEQCALLMYQEDQRRAWHHAIPLLEGAWDILVLDDLDITCTFDRLYCKEHRRIDHDFNSRVSASDPFFFLHLLMNSF